MWPEWQTREDCFVALSLSNGLLAMTTCYAGCAQYYFLTPVLLRASILTMNISTVTTKGQATIPEEIRLLLNIQSGDKIFYKSTDSKKKQFLAEVISTKNVVEELAGSLKTRVKFVSRKHERQMAGLALAKKYQVRTQWKLSPLILILSFATS